MKKKVFDLIEVSRKGKDGLMYTDFDKPKPQDVDAWNNTDMIPRDWIEKYTRRHRKLGTDFVTETETNDPETNTTFISTPAGDSINAILTRYKCRIGRREKDLYYYEGVFYIISKLAQKTIVNERGHFLDDWTYIFKPYTGTATDSKIWNSIKHHITPAKLTIENGKLTDVEHLPGSDMYETDVPACMLNDQAFIEDYFQLTCAAC